MNEGIMITQEKWAIIRRVVDEANASCSHVSVATVNADGSPHVTPIGSLALRDDPSGYFFGEFCSRTRENLNRQRLPKYRFLWKSLG